MIKIFKQSMINELKKIEIELVNYAKTQELASRLARKILKIVDEQSGHDIALFKRLFINEIEKGPSK